MKVFVKVSRKIEILFQKIRKARLKLYLEDFSRFIGSNSLKTQL